jgi:hypothetical protein
MLNTPLDSGCNTHFLKNEGIISTEVAPFGGVKESGIGNWELGIDKLGIGNWILNIINKNNKLITFPLSITHFPLVLQTAQQL